MKIHRFHIAALLIISVALSSQSVLAQTAGEGIGTSQSCMDRQGNLMVASFTLDFSRLKLESNNALLITPRIVSLQDTLVLPAVGIYGRSRYYHYLREDKGMLSGEKELSFRDADKPKELPYSEIVPYANWMDGAQLELHCGKYGCCHKLLEQNTLSLITYEKPLVPEPYQPEFIYVHPVEETVKHRSLSGQAFIDFPVNKTEIQEEYRNNAAELSRIRASINSIRQDQDARITSLFIKGFASPEGSYANNERLARGRTESLSTYVTNLYHFEKGIIITDYEPENWEGFRDFVQASQLPGKEGILDLMNSDRKPDDKEKAIRQRYPKDYLVIKEICYPALRRTDYRIEYDVRHYVNPQEIRSLVDNRPQNLSLGEFYTAAQDLEAGSDAFNHIFETAARMFPQSEAANLNAAVSALQRGDFKSAKAYLSRAGESPEAIYSRGVLAAMEEDYLKADDLFKQVRALIPQAESAREQIEKHINNNY